MSETVTPSSDLQSFLGPSLDVDRLYDNVQAVVPGVTLALIKMMAWNTIEEFYIRSTVNRREASWQMASGVYTVDFNPYDANFLVAWILDFRGLSRYKIIPPGRVVDTFPTASTRNGHALLALKPASMNNVDAGDCCGPEFWSTWFNGVLDGVLWRLYRVPAKPYSSLQLAEYHGKRYRNAISEAKAVANSGLTDGGGRWGFPLFAPGRRKN